MGPLESHTASPLLRLYEQQLAAVPTMLNLFVPLRGADLPARPAARISPFAEATGSGVVVHAAWREAGCLTQRASSFNSQPSSDHGADTLPPRSIWDSHDDGPHTPARRSLPVNPEASGRCSRVSSSRGQQPLAAGATTLAFQRLHGRFVGSTFPLRHVLLDGAPDARRDQDNKGRHAGSRRPASISASPC
jgi:hypothetical protein